MSERLEQRETENVKRAIAEFQKRPLKYLRQVEDAARNYIKIYDKGSDTQAEYAARRWLRHLLGLPQPQDRPIETTSKT